MDSLFTNYNRDYNDDDDDYQDYLLEENKKINLNLEDLYESKKKSDLIRLSMYNKMLQRIHQKIKTTSRQRTNNQICFFVMPEIMIGFPKYDIAEAVHYIMSNLDDNGFRTKYIHPNLIIISWAHWVPDYVRKQLKKKTGIEVNSFGEKIEEEPEQDSNFKVSFLKNKNSNTRQNINSEEDYNSKFIKNSGFYRDNNKNVKQPKDFKVSKPKPKKEYNSIEKFNPENNLVYDEDLLFNIKKNVN
tara:strand:+ start:2486 stop:3217 length:732 start_codon:yes stop_codon:yes gene_type:complete